MTGLWEVGTLFLCLSLGTLVGLPVSPIYIAAGAVGGLWSLWWVALALAIHLVISFFLTHSVVRPRLNRWVHHFDKRLPDAHAMGPARVVWLTRFVPVPLCVQSYFLCLCGVPLGKYFAHSLLSQLVVATAFILAGGALVRGHWMLLAGALAVIILLTIFVRTYGSQPASR